MHGHTIIKFCDSRFYNSQNKFQLTFWIRTEKGCSGADVRADILRTMLYAIQIWFRLFSLLCEKCKRSVIRSVGKDCNAGVALTGVAGFFFIIAHAPFAPALDTTLIRIEWPHKSPLFPRSQVDQHLTSSVEVRDARTCICCNSEYMVWWLFMGTTLTYPFSCVAAVASQDKIIRVFFNTPISAFTD